MGIDGRLHLHYGDRTLEVRTTGEKRQTGDVVKVDDKLAEGLSAMQSQQPAHDYRVTYLGNTSALDALEVADSTQFIFRIQRD